MSRESIKRAGAGFPVTKLVAANCFDLSPSFSLSEDRHEQWEFVYVDSGEVFCDVGGERLLCKRGDVIFHVPGETHGTVCNGKMAASIFNVIFDCRCEAMKFFAGKSLRVPQEISALLKELINECNLTFHTSKFPLKMREDAPLGGETLVKVYIEAFLLRLLRYYSEKAQQKENLVSDSNEPNVALVEEVCAFLRENVSARITLTDLCERFHFGKSYLCEHFKKVTGVSLMNFHLELKLNEAKRLLREERMPIREVAESLGFESPEYFSRCFRSRVGHSPREYRRMLINDSDLRRRK